MAYIEINNVIKSYDGENNVLKNLDLIMEEGSLTTLLGPSGCGKSTLLRSIAGLENVDSGDILINGRRVNDLLSRDRNIGMVFQHYALFPNMTVEQNIRFGLEMQKVDEAEKNKRVAEMIKLVELEGKEKSYPRELSGGQQQRVALARSLVTQPDVLLLDEPLSALDAKIRVSLRQMIKDIQRELGITIIFVTHDQEEAMTMSEYIYVMNDGNIEQAGTPSDIYRHPRNEFVARFIGNHNVYTADEFSELSGESFNDSSIIAIRPETLSLAPLDGEQLSFQGEIIGSAMLGPVLEYIIDVGSQRITIADLNRSANFQEIGKEVTLYILEEDLIKIP